MSQNTMRECRSEKKPDFFRSKSLFNTKLLPVFIFFILSAPVFAANALTVNRMFGNHMVLQRDANVPVWGSAAPGKIIRVTVGDQKNSTKADENGEWFLRLPPAKAGGPHVMTISDGQNKIKFEDILFGDVWLCSGQSNMNRRVAASKDKDSEITAANYPEIRSIDIPRLSAIVPQKNLMKPAPWQICSPKTVGSFSAVGYFFARDLHNELKVPVGIIHASIGGTLAESWTAVEVLEADPDFTPILERFNEAVSAYPENKKKYDEEVERRKQLTAPEQEKLKSINPPMYFGQYRAPYGLYNGMIYPLVPYAIKGVLWYQGEANASRAFQYRKLLPAMISDWRKKWNQGDFPFLIVQLANYKNPQKTPQDDSWAELREAQTMTLNLSNTAMAVTIDIGEADDIHPQNKQDVGKRLFLAALKKAYDKDIVYSGPTYKSMSVEEDKIRVSFDNIGGGLVAKDGDLKRFSIAGKDKKFQWANAKIDGDTVIVSSDEVRQPAAVRYAWEINPEGCNLYNKEGLPAVPFRTDDWPLSTRNAR